MRADRNEMITSTMSDVYLSTPRPRPLWLDGERNADVPTGVYSSPLATDVPARPPEAL